MALQYLERRVAEMEIRCSGGIHYQGTQLHLETVIAISNCHYNVKDRSYLERKGYLPDNMSFSRSSMQAFSSAHMCKRSV